jgi:ABC-type branched-subunit amino acid transport system ATPase component
MNAIKVTHITKTFGGLRAVDDLSIKIPRGITTGLIGPNGSGKTTLMNLLTGILTPDCGEITVDGKSFPRVNPIDLRKLRIARTFQDGRLINQISVMNNLLLAIAKTGIVSGLAQVDLPAEALTKADAMLSKLHLIDHRDALVESLSYGQRKLLELGRAIIQDADIYLLDEPFTGLFPAVVEQVAELLTELKASGKTLVIIEHNIGLIRRLSDNIIVLDHGQLLANGTPSEVLTNKKVQEAYLGV